MTQKELLYVEDAIGHEDIMIGVINNTIEKLEDSLLITFMESELKKHNKCREKLMNLLEEKTNE